MAGGRVLVPGSRDVRGTLDGPEPGDGARECVVACPPHPRHGGNRSDARLVAVGDALTSRGIACLRFDYGPWDGGPDEVSDAGAALGWAAGRFGRVAAFGYSFGGAVALLAAARYGTDRDGAVAAVSALAPVRRLDADLDAVRAIDALADRDVPVQVVYGTRDTSADWRPVVDRARDRGCAVAELPADHFFLTRHGDVGAVVADFLADRP